MKPLLILVLICFSTLVSLGQTKISALEASKHIGDTVLVIDKVYGSKVFENGTTLLNMGGDFPNHLLTLMIRADDKSKFTYQLDKQLQGKYILVTGKIVDYKGKPEIVITDPKQIEELRANDPRLDLKGF